MHADNCMADLVNICVHVDCTAINNQVNNIPSLPSGPCIQWGGGGGGGGGVQLHPFASPLATGIVSGRIGDPNCEVYILHSMQFRKHVRIISQNKDRCINLVFFSSQSNSPKR